MPDSNPGFKSFREFYPFYISQHSNITSRRLHFIGLLLGLIWLVCVIAGGMSLWYLLVSLLLGYGFGFVGHFVFEKNKPATFRYPLYSFIADFKMMTDILSGKIKY
ncbi:MAG TPA: DUF962 domain-containing protein [Bacteroidia bacterium]|jgi:hypothetical protein|nr:DUF962 domain-containing protein [Bacteroidia bacterium]